MITNSDKELFQLIKEDDRLAFDELYNRYWLPLFNKAYKRLRDKEACCDILQDIFADLWNKRATREIENISAYFNGALKNKIFTLLAEGKASGFFVQPFENMVSASSADSSFNQKEINHLLYLWMQSLPERRREIFRMKYYEGASTRFISEQLNISQKTVQNQLLLAFNDLRVHISHYVATTGIIVTLHSDVFLK